MSISLNDFSPNTPIQSAEVDQNFTNLKTAVENVSYRAFPWAIVGTLTVGNEQGMKFIVPQNLTLSKIYAKTGSGTATIRIQKDTTDILASFGVSDTVGSTTTFDSSTISVGQIVTLDITEISSATDLFITLECQVTSIA